VITVKKLLAYLLTYFLLTYYDCKEAARILCTAAQCCHSRNVVTAILVDF